MNKAFSQVGGLRKFDRIAAAKAVAHPIRAAILARLRESAWPLSPVGLSNELDESLEVVSYHFKALEKMGCIVLETTTPRRGATEHFYRALVEITVEIKEL